MPDDPNPCLTCPLPECNEKDPRCRLRTRTRKSRWQEQIDRVAQLKPGEHVMLPPVYKEDVKLLQTTLYHLNQGRGRLPVRTRSIPLLGEEMVELEVWRTDGMTDQQRHWGHWEEYTEQVRVLEPGEECAFALPTLSDLRRLQNAIGRLGHRLGMALRTWRTHDPLTLHVWRGG